MGENGGVGVEVLGGNQICAGKGQSWKANCLSKPYGKAMIVYGITGVCHQTANRILRPSRKTVSDAKAYAASWALYGAYGGSSRIIDPIWITQKVKCRVLSLKPDPVYLDGETENYFESIDAAHSNMASEIRKNRASEEELMNDLAEVELRALIDSRLDHSIVDTKIKSIVNSRVELISEIDSELKSVIDLDSFSSAADKTNKMLNNFLDSVSNVLSPEEYKSIFDVEPGTEIFVVNEGILKKQMNKK